MPVPGPRTQSGPIPGYDNPGLEQPDRFNQWNRPGPVAWAGRSPGLMVVNLRGNILGAGQIRRLWRQAIALIPAQAPFSWSRSAPAPGRPVVSPGPLGITRALRYMARSVYAGGGSDNTRYAGLHTVIPSRIRHKQITTGAGQVRGRPTIRNRISSFGSRVPPLNQALPATEGNNQQ